MDWSQCMSMVGMGTPRCRAGGGNVPIVSSRPLAAAIVAARIHLSIAPFAEIGSYRAGKALRQSPGAQTGQLRGRFNLRSTSENRFGRLLFMAFGDNRLRISISSLIAPRGSLNQPIPKGGCPCGSLGRHGSGEPITSQCANAASDAGRNENAFFQQYT